MNGVTWQQCCEEALEYSAAMGMCLTSKAHAVMQWYRSFHFKWKFTRPPCKKHNVPPFLQKNPDICSAMQQHGREHLADLSIEMMVEYIHNIVLPSMVAEERSATVEEVREIETSYQEEVKAILKRYGLTCICPAPVRIYYIYYLLRSNAADGQRTADG
jgi:hypothetical protein